MEMSYRKAAILALEAGLTQMSEYLEFKADWILYWTKHPKPSIGTTGCLKDPFRPTKEEIATQKEDLNNQPNGRAGYPRQTAGAMGDYASDFVPASALKSCETLEEVQEVYAEILQKEK
jgi:hypothetical protein